MRVTSPCDTRAAARWVAQSEEASAELRSEPLSAAARAPGGALQLVLLRAGQQGVCNGVCPTMPSTVTACADISRTEISGQFENDLPGETGMNSRKMALAVTMTLAFLPFGIAVAAEEVADDSMDVTYKIDEMTCRQLLRMSGDSRDFTVIFMQGFVSGKKAELLFDAVPLTEATDKAIDICIDNPDGKMLAAFEKARSHDQ